MEQFLDRILAAIVNKIKRDGFLIFLYSFLSYLCYFIMKTKNYSEFILFLSAMMIIFALLAIDKFFGIEKQ